MPQNTKIFQVCMNLNSIQVLLLSNLEPENACMVLKTFTGEIILPEDLEDKTQRGRDKFKCKDGSILALHEDGFHRYCFTFIPSRLLEPST